MTDLEDHLDAQYESSFPRLAGYLPESREAVDRWQSEFVARLADGPTEPAGAVLDLRTLLRNDAIVRMYVIQMMEQVQPPHNRVRTVDQLLRALTRIIHDVPRYDPDPRQRIAFPMSALFVYMMMTPAGQAVFRNEKFNSALQKVLKDWCGYLDSADSCRVLNEGPEGWLSPEAVKEFDLDDFEIDRTEPHWGFTSYNDYFHRRIRPDLRPVDPDPKAIVSANDGTVWKIAHLVREYDRFWLKGQPYSLADMMAGSPYAERFVNGHVLQSFLSGADYHRWHAPVSGTVRGAEVVSALMFSNAESAGQDKTAGTHSQGYQSSVNTRGLVFIEADDPKIGMVCVVPIGITEISSVTLSVTQGDTVRKGQELGYFSYGGSSMCLVLQQGAVGGFGTLKEKDVIKVNAKIARAG
ncbi:phophatidylserine decarboxylase associated domain-containing protein [Kitasatospora sp. NPDC001603]|uniref:phophatidylserine decarboxylase associated domain-containing protein n=1 Tax=Kitasatospora sp. NPDC001603 TaxID=3154388 RepID=UPI00332C1D4B